MKIQKLLLENINSLYGKWCIDFENNAFRNSGIFAITGKTGSGKTTILDAVCLALYAETPRVSRPASLEFVSIGASRAMASLEFSIGEDQYEATFAFGSFLRGDHAGQINPNFSHKLKKNGVVIADKTMAVRREIEAVSGMDKIRFCRAAMLAQGAFDAFLSAKPDEKADILEQITGTKIYQEISDQIATRRSSEKDALNQLDNQLKMIRLLSDEDKNTLSNQLSALSKSIQLQNTQKNTIDQLCITLDNRKRLLTKQSELKIEGEKLNALVSQFSVNQQRLIAAQKTLPPKPTFELLKQLRLDQNRELADCNRMKTTLDAQEKLLTEANQSAESCKNAYLIFLNNAKARSELIRQVDELDQKIHAIKNSLDELTHAFSTSSNDSAKIIHEHSCIQLKIKSLEQDNLSADSYLQNHPEDAVLKEKRPLLVTLLNGVNELCNNEKDLLKAQKNAREEEEAYRKKTDELQKQSNSFRDTIQPLTQKQKLLLDSKELLLHGNTLEAFQDKRNLLVQNKILLERVLSLEGHRKQLQNGIPCPLCGATSHPYATEKIPPLSNLEVELNRVEQTLKQIQTLQSEIIEMERDSARRKEAWSATQTELALCSSMIEQKAALSANNQEDLMKIRQKITEKASLIQKEFLFFSITWTFSPQNTVIPEEFDARILQFERFDSSRKMFQERKQKLTNEFQTLDALLQEKKKAMDELEQKKEAVSAQLFDLQTQRISLFGTQNTTIETDALESERQAQDKKLQQSQLNRQSALEHRNRTNEEYQAYRLRTAQRVPEIQRLYELFLQLCKEQSISEEEFMRSTLPDAELSRLSADNARIDTACKKHAEECSENSQLLANANAAIPDHTDECAVRQEKESLEESIRLHHQELGAIQTKLQINETNEKESAELRALFATQQKQTDLWEHLYELTTHGSRLQRSAQGITLEHLLGLANLELAKINPRYELLRSSQEPLAIHVIDHEQGDELRPCSNLSGGERFLVSLALALGLSGMAGEKIRIESLFMDEGFGSLDSDALEVALDTLASLRQRGKTVGIISHVPTIAEKIGCVIEVISQGGGHSILAGPGVSRMD